MPKRLLEEINRQNLEWEELEGAEIVHVEANWDENFKEYTTILTLEIKGEKYVWTIKGETR